MKKIILLVVSLLAFANLWCQVNFYIETDTTVYYQNQYIEISFIIHNCSDDTLYLTFYEVPPFFYYIDGVFYDPPAWQVVVPVCIPPDSLDISYVFHDQPLSLGTHSIIGGFPYQPPYNNWYTDPIEIIIIENVAVEDNSVGLNYSQLYQNYPNPFSKSVTISYQLPEEVKSGVIKIYNIRGQLVNQLQIANSQLNWEQSSIKWDGKDENGKPVQTGVYFSILEIDRQIIDCHKLILLR